MLKTKTFNLQNIRSYHVKSVTTVDLLWTATLCVTGNNFKP